MKIIKYLHSCLLLELDGKRLLFDPGNFSFANGPVTPADLPPIDYLVVTHDHPDHLDPAAIRALANRDSPELIGNTEVAEKLRGEGHQVTVFDEGERSFGPFTLEAVPVTHQPILAERTPVVTAFLINGSILNPGDSFSDDLLRFRGCKLLFCPITAPFLTEVQAYTFMVRMQPGAVFAVHDGYVQRWFAEARHQNFRAYLAKQEIGFHGILDAGGSIEL